MIDPTAVDNPWAVIAVGLVLAYLAYKGHQSAKHAKRAARSIEHEANPNSGNSMTDKLDRIEIAVALIPELSARVATLEAAAEKRGRRRMWRPRSR